MMGDDTSTPTVVRRFSDQLSVLPGEIFRSEKHHNSLDIINQAKKKIGIGDSFFSIWFSGCGTSLSRTIYYRNCLAGDGGDDNKVFLIGDDEDETSTPTVVRRFSDQLSVLSDLKTSQLARHFKSGFLFSSGRFGDDRCRWWRESNHGCSCRVRCRSSVSNPTVFRQGRTLTVVGAWSGSTSMGSGDRSVPEKMTGGLGLSFGDGCLGRWYGDRCLVHGDRCLVHGVGFFMMTGSRSENTTVELGLVIHSDRCLVHGVGFFQNLVGEGDRSGWFVAVQCSNRFPNWG